jgi:hypothetical protein
MKADLKNLHSELVGADYSTHRLAILACLENETAWGDLSMAEIAELDAWLEKWRRRGGITSTRCMFALRLLLSNRRKARTLTGCPGSRRNGR